MWHMTCHVKNLIQSSNSQNAVQMVQHQLQTNTGKQSNMPKEIPRTRLSDSLNPSTSKPSGIPCYCDTLRLVARLNSRVDTKVLYKREMDIWKDPQIGVGLNGDELQQLSRMVHEAIGSMFKNNKYNPSTDEYTQKALHALRRTICHYWKGELSLLNSLIIEFARGESPLASNTSCQESTTTCKEVDEKSCPPSNKYIEDKDLSCCQTIKLGCDPETRAKPRELEGGELSTPSPSSCWKPMTTPKLENVDDNNHCHPNMKCHEELEPMTKPQEIRGEESPPLINSCC